MIILKDTDKMPFGKYKGFPLSDVPASYFFWLWTKCGREKQVKTDSIADYIWRNIHILQKEHPDGIWQ